MKVKNILITGANRGIGVEFVRQLAHLEDAPDFIFATYRNADNLQELLSIQSSAEKSQIILIKMDITKEEEVDVAKQIIEQRVKDRGLNLLINNAAICKAESFPLITAENLQQHYETNTVGPIMVMKKMLPLLEKAATTGSGIMSVTNAAVLNISSTGGSISSTGFHPIEKTVPAYKISKAALNMAMKSISTVVKDQGVLVVMMCPGWVKTDMGGMEQAMLEAQESIEAMIKTMEQLGEKDQGHFVDRFGKDIPF